jgi:hypothetical protein
VALAIDEGGDGWLIGVRRGQPSSLVLHLDDDVVSSFGGSRSAPMAWAEWDTDAATENFRIVLTDGDGVGTDTVVLSWNTGTSTAVFGGASSAIGYLTGNGTVSVPGYRFTNYTNTGLYMDGDKLAIARGGTRMVSFGGGPAAAFNGDVNMVSSLVYSSTQVLELGTSPSNPHSLVAGDAAIGGSFGVEGDAYIDGVTIHYDHIKFVVMKTGLTDASSNDFVRIAVPQGEHVGGTIQYSIHADDGSDFQSRNGIITFAAVNPTGTEVCDVQIAAASEAVAVSAGTLVSSFGCASNAADTVDISVTPNSSLTPTTLEIHYQVHLDQNETITDL